MTTDTESTAIDYAKHARPARDWTREQRIEWAQARFGDDAQFFWVVYRLDAAGFQSKAGEAHGLDMDENSWAQAHGAGRYRRELRVRGQRGSFLTEDFGIAPDMTRAAVSGTVIDSPDRLAAIEARLDAMARGAGAVGGLSGVSVGGLGIRDVIEIARMLQPPAPPPAAPQSVAGLLDSLLMVKRLARDLYNPAAEPEEHEESAGMGGIIRDVLTALTSSTPAPPAPAVPQVIHQQPAPTVTPAPAPPAPSVDPFPGASIIAQQLQGELIPSLPPTLGKEGLPPAIVDQLADAFADAIESALGNPIAVAERFRTGEAITTAMVRVAPGLESWRGLMLTIADRFVAIQTGPEEESA